MPLDYFVWLVRNGQRAGLVDTGFDEPMARRRGRRIVRPVGEGLASLGVSLEAIDNVVITRMHYDHTGNFPLFLRALPPAGQRDGLRHRTLHVSRGAASQYRGGARRRHGAPRVRRPGAIP
jgi:glyoxylase-like metal-dependent hydrolase (beta-lactamase superfamily II)